MTVRSRFAPSPTGFLHIGGARTALYAWLYARRAGGKFILRIEDTDRERSTQESVDAIFQGMEWLGLDYDEGPFYQTQRFDRYAEVIQTLLAAGDAYHCYCSREELDTMRSEQMARKEKPRYDGRCRDLGQVDDDRIAVIRFRNPQEGEVVFDDLVRGVISVHNQEMDDLIIARSDGTPTYNLTVVVDDLDMGMDVVIRGDDHINNTPRQINILRALGAEPPKYAHVPMILGEDGARLSKRHGAVSVLQYREEGYLPEALLNYLVRLGWSHGDQEIFSIEELIQLFALKDINRAASTFNTDKLIWLNHHYIMHSDPAIVAGHLQWHFEQRGLSAEAGPALVDLVKLQRERCKTLVELVDASLFFYQDIAGYDEKAVKKHFKAKCLPVLQYMQEHLASLDEWDAQSIHSVVNAAAEALERKMGDIAQPIRVAIAGKAVSPSIDVTLEALGREKTLLRIAAALQWVEAKLAVAGG